MNDKMDQLLMNIHAVQSHLGIMIGTLVFTIIGLIFILVHASGRWLTTTVWHCVILYVHHLFDMTTSAAYELASPDIWDYCSSSCWH